MTEGETAALLDAMHRFFALPEAEQLALDNVNSPHFRGYTRTGDERTGGSRDWQDQLDIGAERPARRPGPGEPAYWWLEGPNQWPAALPELRTAALAWIDRLSSVAARLLRELLTAIGAPADFYEPIFGERAHPHLKLVRYPGSAGDGADQGVGAHKDYGFLTLLLQDQVGGLQVQREDGLFHEVPPLPGRSWSTWASCWKWPPTATSSPPTTGSSVRPGPPNGSPCPSSTTRAWTRVEPLSFPHASAAPGVTDDPANPLFAGTASTS